MPRTTSTPMAPRAVPGRFATLTDGEAALLHTHYRTIGLLTAQRIQGGRVDQDALQDLLDTCNRESSHCRLMIAEAFTHYNRQVIAADGILLTQTCDHLVLRGRAPTDHRGDPWCRACADAQLVYPEDDHELYDRDDLYRHSNGSLYTYEQDDDDDDDDQDTDGEGEGNGCSSLRSYSTVAHVELTAVGIPPDSARSRDFHLGIELEVQSRRRRSSDVEQVLGDLGDDYILCKEDASLDDELGFEIVTAPRPLATHLQALRAWEPPYGLRAWDPGCCGMHVHIDSRAFTPATLARLLAFYNKRANTDLISQVAGRHPETSSQCRSYANYDSADGSFTALRRAKRQTDANRYVMVNTTTLSYQEAERLQVANRLSHNTRGFSTVEIRVFRASLRKARLLAQIEFAHAVLVFCRHTSASQLEASHFRAWLSTEYSQYPALARFLGIDVPRRRPSEPLAPRAAERMAA